MKKFLERANKRLENAYKSLETVTMASSLDPKRNWYYYSEARSYADEAVKFLSRIVSKEEEDPEVWAEARKKLKEAQDLSTKAQKFLQ